MQPTIRVAGTADELAWMAAQRLVEAVDNALVATGKCALALSGGSTPQRLYQLLATEYAARLPWAQIHILFADERCVPTTHPDSNFGAACRLLLDHVPIPYENIHRMAGEKEPQTAAAEYDELLLGLFPKGVDLAILGMGADGHTASLFPETKALSAIGDACVANWVEKLGAWRLTMTAEYLNKAFDVLVLVEGETKALAVERALVAGGAPLSCPIRLIQPASGRLLWLMDAAAAGMGNIDDAEDDQQNLEDDAADERGQVDG